MTYRHYIAMNEYQPQLSSHDARKDFNKKSIFFLLILALYSFLSPFYVFTSGMPQPADMVLLVGVLGMFIAVAANSKLRLQTVYVAGATFAGYTILINLIHCYFYYDFRFLLSAFYYVFNFLSFGFVTYVFLRNPKNAHVIMRCALYLAIAVQFWLLFSHGYVRRAESTFNNPNQLAYWGLLAGIMLCILNYRRRFHFLDLVALTSIGYIQAHALSKAGLITYGLLLFVTIFTPRIGHLGRAFLFVLAVLSCIFAAFDTKAVNDYSAQITSVQRVAARLENIGQERDDSVTARGYDRIVNYPEYAVLGAGEGAFFRFHPRGRNQEMHSGLGTLIFSYGIFGFFFFSLFLFHVFQGRPWYCFAYLIILMLYGLTHQNIRFTEFWIFLGLVNTIPKKIPEKFLRPASTSAFASGRAL